MAGEDLRRSRVSVRIRAHRLIVVLRRIEPTARLVELVRELAALGAEIFEITMDGADAPGALRECRHALVADGGHHRMLGAGTVRTREQLDLAVEAGADFGVSPVLDHDILRAAIDAGLPFVPGAYTPTEVDAAWRAGATFVKLFPASSLGPEHLRELRGPLGEIEVIPTGGIDATSAGAFLGAGAVAVGIGSAMVKADADRRRAILEAVRSSR